MLAAAPLVIGIVLMFMPSQIAGQCSQWTIASNWALHQDNKIDVNMVLRQTGNKITGTAAYPGRKHVERGTVTGSFEDTGSAKALPVLLHLKIKWDYGETGIYGAKVAYGMRLEGAAYIEEHAGDAERDTTWHSDDNVVRCSKK